MTAAVDESRLEDLRGEVRSFVAANRMEGLEEIEAHPSHDRLPSAAVRAWTERLRSGRWLCLSWPEEYGGRGLNAMEIAVVNEEFAKAGQARVVLNVGEKLVAPTLLAHGTPGQCRRFLPGILAGTDRWCQGFSEPEAGSDLASVRTRGVLDGDELVITGQKVWTSEAQFANWISLLCRTDPEAPKHKGLTLVLVPLKQAGIVVRPLRQAHGASGFNEIFFDEARASLADVVGGLGNGWKVSNTTLGAERGGEATIQHLGYRNEWDTLVEIARSNGKLDDPLFRQRFADAYTQIQLMRFAGMRQFASLATGNELGPVSSTYKLLYSEYHKRFGELALDVIGPWSMILPPSEGYEVDRWQRIFFETRARCISRGTNEIQRNILAEKVLGLPREK